MKAILPMIYASTFIVSLSPFRSQCDMGDVNDGRTGSVGVSIELNTLASSNPYLKLLFHVKISNFL